MEHKSETYKELEEKSSIAQEAMPLYDSKAVPMSHIQMSFGLDVPQDEDVEMLKLRIVAFAEYLSTKAEHSTRAMAIRKINKLMLLDDNWDGYGSPQVDANSAMHARRIVTTLQERYLLMLRISPTEDGSISLRMIRGDNDSVGIICRKSTMSYFIERKNAFPDFYSDIEYTHVNIHTLIDRIEEW